MVQSVERKRSEICRYLTPQEKLDKYKLGNRIFPTLQEVRTPYHVLGIAREIGNDQLVILPRQYNIMGNIDGRSYMQSGPVIEITGQDPDFIKAAKIAVDRYDSATVPRGLGWRMGQVLVVQPIVCSIDGHVLYEAIEGKMSDSLFATHGWKRERIKVTPNYRENNIICEVPSRSLKGTHIHIVTIHNPPTEGSKFEWWDTLMKHVCGDTTYNREFTVGSSQFAEEEHDIAGCRAAGKVFRFKTNFVLPIKKEPVAIYKRLVNQFLQLDSDINIRKTGRGGARNLREYEREFLFEAHIIERRRTLHTVADELFYDSMGEFERELEKDNYIFQILFHTN